MSVKRKRTANFWLLLFAWFFAAASLQGQYVETSPSWLKKLQGEEAAPQKQPKVSAREQIPMEGLIDPRVYCLGPGDEVDVSIWGSDLQLSYQLFVSAEGRILVPPAGPLEVGGKTISEAERYLGEVLASYFSNATVSLTLMNPRIFKVFTVGAVRQPGAYVLTAVDRVSTLIGEAGGIKRGGSKRRVQMLDREKNLLKTVDLMLFEATGDMAYNPFLTDGCIVEVPPVEHYVVLRGRFPNLTGFDTLRIRGIELEDYNQFTVEFFPGESLKDILELVGGVEAPQVYSGARMVTDEGNSGKVQYVPLTEDLMTQELRDRAVYEFPVQALWVYVTGAVNVPGRFIHQPGWTVTQYLSVAGGPRYEGSTETCFILAPDGSRHKGNPSEIPLPGETIFVPEKKTIWAQRIFPAVFSLTSVIISIISLSK